LEAETVFFKGDALFETNAELSGKATRRMTVGRVNFIVDGRCVIEC
jgi:hypothetical protein